MLRTNSPTIIALVVGLFAFTAAAIMSTTSTKPSGAAQVSTSLSVDECVRVDAGETVDISLYISDVSELLAWEIYFAYDRHLLEVIGRDVRVFLSEGPNSNVFDFSDPVPNSTGVYRLAAADVALGGFAESGSGRLATITLRAIAEGISPAAIYRSETLPLGPRLTAAGGEKIGDVTGNEIFDGRITSGQIAIGRSCAPVAPTPDPDIESDFTVAPVSPITITSGPGGQTPGAGGTSAPDPANGDPDSTGGPPDPDASPAGGNDGGNGNGNGPGATGDPTDRPAISRDSPGGGSGIGSSSDNTFWAIVLIGGGVTLGLVLTGVFAIVTRRPA